MHGTASDRQREYFSLFYCDDSRRRNKGRTADALASIGDERRGKLRKWSGIGKHELIRPFLNGATRQVEDLSRIQYGQTQGTETSKYLKEKKERSISLVVASEQETAQTVICYGNDGVIGPHYLLIKRTGSIWKVTS